MPYWRYISLFCLFCTSCSLGSSPLPKTIAVSTKKTPLSSIREIDSSSNLYQISGTPEDRDLFLSVIEDCSPNYDTSKKVHSRRLLVGFEKPFILEQESVNAGNQEVLLTRANAALEGKRVSLFLAERFQKQCLEDYVFWYFPEKTEEQEDIEQKIVTSSIIPTLSSLLGDKINFNSREKGKN